ERREHGERLCEEVDDVADQKDLHGSVLALAVAGEKVAREHARLQQQSAEGPPRTAVELGHAFDELRGEVLDGIIVANGRLAALRAIRSRDGSAASDAVRGR